MFLLLVIKMSVDELHQLNDQLLMHIQSKCFLRLFIVLLMLYIPIVGFCHCRLPPHCPHSVEETAFLFNFSELPVLSVSSWINNRGLSESED